jgi:prefoldin subunit 5
VQELHQQLKAKDAELQALKASVAELQTAVRRLTQASQGKD